MCCHQRDHSVSGKREPASVQPSGHPINHSTNTGFNRRGEVWSDRKHGAPCSFGESSGRENPEIASVSVVPALCVAVVGYPADPLPTVSIPVGIGHISTAPSKSNPPVCVAVLFVFGPPLGGFGVGQSPGDEDAFAKMCRPHLCR